MEAVLSPEFKQVLTEKLANSLADPLPAATPRRVFGRLGMAGKATAVIGMRRAGKTTFLHQLRRVAAARELRALHEAALQHPRARRRLLTATRDGAPAAAVPDVVVQPAYAWMLGEAD